MVPKTASNNGPKPQGMNAKSACSNAVRSLKNLERISPNLLLEKNLNSIDPDVRTSVVLNLG